MTAHRPIALALALVTVAAPCVAAADSLEETFERANGAYFRGDFDTAAREYRRLIDLGVVDADVAFDLATAEARLGHYGAAIQYYEQAMWLRPGDDDAHEGLEAARSALGRRRAQSQGEAEVDSGPPLAEALFGSISRDVLAISTVFLDLVLFGILIGLLFVERESVRLALGIAAPLVGIVLLASGAGLALRSGWLEEGDPAIVLRERVALREGPDAEAAERHRALEGQRAWVTDRDGAWALVRVPSVGEGWVEAAHVGLVRPSE